MGFLNINEALHHLDLEESMVAAEFGCGTADFALAMAKILNKGRVYALDIQEEKLQMVKNKMLLQKISHIETILCDLEKTGGSGLKNSSLDAVLIPNILFQTEDRYAIMKEAERTLKPGGQILVIDRLKPALRNLGENLVTPEEVKKIGRGLGFWMKKEFAAGDYHYALLFIKQPL